MQEQLILSTTSHSAVIAMASSSGACIEVAIDAAKQQTEIEQVESASAPGSPYIGETQTTTDQGASYHRYNLYLKEPTSAQAYIVGLADTLRTHMGENCAVKVQT